MASRKQLQLFDDHYDMLADGVRMTAYAEAIRRTVRPGDRVLDLGAGLGILGFMALKAGAAHVYAVEKSDSIDLPGSEPTKPLGGSKGKSGGKGADSKGADSKGADSKGADSKGADSKGANSKPAPQAAKDTNPPAKERADDKAAKSGNNSEDDEK